MKTKYDVSFFFIINTKTTQSHMPSDPSNCHTIDTECSNYVRANRWVARADRLILLLKVIVVSFTLLMAASILLKDKSLHSVAQKVCLYTMGAAVALTCLMVMYEHYPQLVSAADLLKPIQKRKLMVVSEADGSVYFGIATFLLVLNVMAMVPPWRKFMWELFSS